MDRTRLRRALRIGGLSAGILLVTACAAIYWLTATASGFRYLLGAVRELPGVSLTLDGVAGTPARGFTVDRLVIDHERVRVEIDALHARLNPVFLLARTVALSELSAATVHVRLKPRLRPPDTTAPQFLPASLRVRAGAATIGHLDIEDASGPLFTADRLRTGVAVSSTRIHVVDADLDAGAYRATGTADLLAAEPLGVSAAVDLVVPLTSDRLDVHAAVTGDLARLHLDAVLDRPRDVRFQGDVDLSGAARLDGRLSVAASELAPLVSGAPLGRIDAQFAIKGNLQHFSIEGPATVQALPIGTLEVTAAGRYVDDTLVLNALRIAAKAGRPEVSASGHVRIKPRLDVDLDLGWHYLRWPLTGNAIVESASGAARVTGGGSYAYTVGGDLHGPALPSATLAALGVLRSDGTDISRLSLRLLGGDVLAAGTVAWQGKQDWRIEASGRRLDPGPLRAGLRGRVNFTAKASGRGFEPRGDWQGTLVALSGEVRGKPVSGGGSASMRNGELNVEQLRLNVASLHASASGTVGRHSNLEVSADLGNLGDFVADAGGGARLRANYAANGGEQKLRGTLDAQRLHSGPLQIASIAAHADVDTASTRSSSFSFATRGIHRGGLVIDSIDVAVDGIAAQHRLTAAARTGERSLELAAAGVYHASNRSETIEIGTLDVNAPALARITLSRPVTAVIGPGHARLERSCVGNGQSEACVAANWLAGGAWDVAAELSQIPLSLLPLPVAQGTHYAGAVSLRGVATGAPGVAVTGHATADLDGIDVRYEVANGRRAGVKIGAGQVSAVATPSQTTVTADVHTTDDSFLSLQATAARSADRAIDEEPLSGRLRLRTRELGLIPLLVRDLDRVAGLLEADLRIDGTVGAPLLDGTLALSDGSADVYLSNLRLKDIAATVGLHGHALDLDGNARAGAGQMSAKGSLRWDDGKPSGALHFTGENLLVANLPEARVVASPDVRLTLAGDRVEVRGEIKVPSATIAPKDLSAAVRVSSDQTIVGATRESATNPLSVDSQVRVTLGSDVRIAAYGLKGLLTGALSVTAKTDELVTGNGELEVKDGHYLAYARELDIERGRLIFRGGPVDNAALDIRASRKLPGYTAGVNVRGTLQAPQLSFFSDPSLPQSQIASLLIVGQTTDVGQGGAGAGSLLMAQGGALLVGDYTHHLGIDQMTIEADSTSGTALVLGKFLSPRLYVSYGISLTQAINTLKLRYTIGDNWVINTESGLNHSADIQYSFQR